MLLKTAINFDLVSFLESWVLGKNIFKIRCNHRNIADKQLLDELASKEIYFFKAIGIQILN